MAFKVFGSMHTRILVIIYLIVLIFLYFIIASLFTPFSSSGIITTHIANLSPAVPGRINQIFVRNNQYLLQGQKVLQIDPIPYQIAFSQAEVNISLTKSKVSGLEASIKAAQQKVMQQQANYDNALQKFNQYKPLYKLGVVSLRQYQDSEAALGSTLAELNQAKAALIDTEQALGQSINGKSVYLIQAENQLAKARYNLDHTLLVAPTNGYLSDVNTQIGSYASPGVLKIPFIWNDDWWVDAYFRENELRLIHPGTSAYVITSLYPGKIIPAKVLSVSFGVLVNNFNQTSTLPQSVEQISWLTKKVYFPVHLGLDLDLNKYPLRLGSIASVVIINPDHPILNAIAFAWFKIKSWVSYIL